MTPDTLSALVAKALTNDSAIEKGRRAIEDHVIAFRDARFSVLGCANGLVVNERDGAASSVIRCSTPDALRIGIKAMLDELSAALTSAPPTITCDRCGAAHGYCRHTREQAQLEQRLTDEVLTKAWKAMGKARREHAARTGRYDPGVDDTLHHIDDIEEGERLGWIAMRHVLVSSLIGERPERTMTALVDGKPVTFSRTLPDPPCPLCGNAIPPSTGDQPTHD